MLAMLASLPLLAAAAAQMGGRVDVCAAVNPMMAAYFLQGGYDMPPEAAKLMADVSTNGNAERIDQDIQLVNRTFKTADAQHWLDLGLNTAVLVDRADIAELLVKRGANVNARPEYPPFNSLGRSWAQMSWQIGLYNEHIYTKATNFNEEPFPPTFPMLDQAAACNHVATLKVLLVHGADMYPKIEEQQNGSKAGILAGAMMNRSDDAIAVLLDHGYDPCRDFALRRNPKHLTDVILAKRMGLSETLSQRITALSTKCSAPAASSTH